MQIISKRLAALAVVAAAPAILAGCDDDDVLGPDAGREVQAEATVFVVHGINGTDLGADEALPVDVSVSGLGCVLEDVRFRDVEGPLSLAAGSYDVEVRLASDEPCAGDVAIRVEGLQLADGDNASVAAHLADGGTPTATAFANDLSAAEGRAKVSPRHAADFGPVDVVVNGQPAFENVPNGGSGTAAVDPGVYTVAIQTPDNRTTAFEADLDLAAGTLYAAYAVGTVSKGTFEVLLQPLAF